MSHEPKPKSPERLSLLGYSQVRHKDGRVRLTVELAYERWCCSGPHELVDAVETVKEVFEVAEEVAQKLRLKEIEKEVNEKLDTD